MSEYLRINQTDEEEGERESLDHEIVLNDYTRSEEKMDVINGFEGYTCRICLEDQCSRAEVIAPCACRGSSKWVHRACLDRWRSVREDKAFSRCTECLQYYQLICITNDTCQEKCVRRTRFSAYVCKDIALIFFSTQFFIILFSWMIYSFDAGNQNLLKLFGMQQHPLLLYYLLGLFLTCSIVGMIGTCIQCQVCGDIDTSTSCYCGDLIWFPYFAPTDSVGGTCLCCPTESCSSITCAECGGCGSCECGSLCAGAGEEMLYIFLVLLVLFAIVGAFIFIFVGIAVIQQIIQKHIHILDKWNLTREYIVKDLAPGAIPIAIPISPWSSPSRPDSHLEDIESNSQNSPLHAIELPVYNNHTAHYRGVSTAYMEREVEGRDLPEPSAPPMESLDSRQRDELIRRGLL